MSLSFPYPHEKLNYTRNNVLFYKENLLYPNKLKITAPLLLVSRVGSTKLPEFEISPYDPRLQKAY
jgi:hypothetical protein